MKPSNYSMFIFWSTIDRVFVVSVPELPGCMAHGETKEKAIANAEEAIQNWLETAREIGRKIPEPRDLETFEAELERNTQDPKPFKWTPRSKAGAVLVEAKRTHPTKKTSK
jgi:predicted RNase H-like HicB family nuclease